MATGTRRPCPLEEYYRALDRLLYELRDCDQFKATPQYQAQQQLIIRDAITLTYLTGIDASAWLFLRLTPFLMESQRFVEKAYGQKFAPDDFQLMENTDTLKYAAQMAVALGALALMGRRTSLDTLPYGLMKVFEQDGGGNRREQAPLDRLNDYLKQLSKEQHYWLNEMRTLRDHEVDNECTYLQMPENHPNDKFMRL